MEDRVPESVVSNDEHQESSDRTYNPHSFRHFEVFESHNRDHQLEPRGF